jgi:hypothetical protein
MSKLSYGQLQPGPPGTATASAFLVEAETLPVAAVLPIGSAGRGSGRLGAVTGPVPDGGNRLLLAEPGPGGEHPLEPVRA